MIRAGPCPERMQPQCGRAGGPGEVVCLGCPAVPTSQSSCLLTDQACYRRCRRAEGSASVPGPGSCWFLQPLCWERPPGVRHAALPPGRLGRNRATKQKPTQTAQGELSASKSSSSPETTITRRGFQVVRSTACGRGRSAFNSCSSDILGH